MNRLGSSAFLLLRYLLSFATPPPEQRTLHFTPKTHQFSSFSRLKANTRTNRTAYSVRGSIFQSSTFNHNLVKTIFCAIISIDFFFLDFIVFFLGRVCSSRVEGSLRLCRMAVCIDWAKLSRYSRPASPQNAVSLPRAWKFGLAKC